MLRSLKLMECTPAGQRTPTVHDAKKLYKEINYKLFPTPHNWGGCLCLYHYLGSQNKHFPNVQCTPKHWLIHFYKTAWFIIFHNSTVHLHWLLPHLWLYWHIVLVIHQNSDVCKCSISLPNLRHGACCRLPS